MDACDVPLPRGGGGGKVMIIGKYVPSKIAATFSKQHLHSTFTTFKRVEITKQLSFRVCKGAIIPVNALVWLANGALIKEIR